MSHGNGIIVSNMKQILSISLGTSKNNKAVETELFGESFSIERLGVDGDQKLFKEKIKEFDGKVDAFGIGGTDLYLYAGHKRYLWKATYNLVKDAVLTPYLDGSGLKHTLERETVKTLHENGTLDFSDKRVLIVSAVDRFGLAEAISQRAKSVVYGDILFGIGLPVPIRSWNTLTNLAQTLLPIFAHLPIDWFYPTGKKQETNTPKQIKYFAEADIIAGDFPLIRKYMPNDLKGKIILTNTTTEADVVELTKRGVKQLITTTPVLDGRSFGTNVMEAALVTLLGKKPDELTPDDYLGKLKELEWKPQVRELNPS